jgi:hypothetical protein
MQPAADSYGVGDAGADLFSGRGGQTAIEQVTPTPDPARQRGVDAHDADLSGGAVAPPAVGYHRANV